MYLKRKNQYLAASLLAWCALSSPTIAADELESAEKAPLAAPAKPDGTIDDGKVDANETISGEIFPNVPLNTQDTLPTAPTTKGSFAGSYLSGLYARSSGNITDSITSMKTALRANPNNIDVARQLQSLLLLDGRTEDAVSLSRDIIALDPSDTISKLLVAINHIKANDIASAAKDLDQLNQQVSNQLWLPLIMAWIDLSRGAIKKPLTADDLPVETSSTTSLVNYHLGLINARAGFTEAAVKNFADAVKELETPPGHIMETVLAFYSQQGQPTILKPLVDGYLRDNPDTILSKNALLISTPQEGVAEVLFTMGSIMLEADATQDASIYLQLALYLRPNYDIAALALGAAFANLQQYTRSNLAYAQVPVISRLHKIAELHMAINYDRMNQTGEAIMRLDAIAKRMPESHEALVAKGDVLRARERYGDAILAYTQALERIKDKKPHHWPIYFARGACHERLQRTLDAEADMQSALALSPDQPEVLNFLAYSWAIRGHNLDEALTMLSKAVAMRPNNGQIVDSHGWALYVMGRYKEALPLLERAAELLPSDPTINDHLGDVYWQLGRKTEARFQWERALSFNPEPKDIPAIEAKIKSGLTTRAAQKTGKNAVASDDAPATSAIANP